MININGEVVGTQKIVGNIKSSNTVIGSVTNKGNVNANISEKNDIGGDVIRPATVFLAQIEFENRANFPLVGETEMLYSANDEMILYRWDDVSARYIPYESNGTNNYEELENIPKLNGIPIIGDKTNEEYGIQELTNQDIEDLLGLSL